MRKVTITFEEGNTATFETLKEAADALRLNRITLLQIALGKSKRTKAILHIESINVAQNRGTKKGLRSTHGKQPLRCISVTGEVVEAESICAALRLIGLEGKNISCAIDDGRFHFGWRFESIEKKEVIKFDKPVDPDLIQKMYACARYYLYKYKIALPDEDKKDIIQYAVNHTASDYSCGHYEKLKDQYPLNYWLIMRVTHWGSKEYYRIARRIRGCVDLPEGAEGDKDEWLGTLATTTDDTATEAMFDEMPEELKAIAEMYNKGMSRLEINAALGITNTERVVLKDRLVEWLQKRIKER